MTPRHITEVRRVRAGQPLPTELHRIDTDRADGFHAVPGDPEQHVETGVEWIPVLIVAALAFAAYVIHLIFTN